MKAQLLALCPHTCNIHILDSNVNTVNVQIKKTMDEMKVKLPLWNPENAVQMQSVENVC